MKPLFIAFFFSLALAQDLNPDRFYYRGTVGTEPRQLELTINNQELTGSVIHSGQLWKLEGNWAYQGPATLREISPDGQEGGLWLAKISADDYAGSLNGMYDNGNAVPFSFIKVADYVRSQIVQSRVESTVYYPFFLEPIRFNEIIQKVALEEQKAFLLEGQHAEQQGEMFNGWSLESHYQIHYASETVLSLLNSRFYYTGGAHPNTDFRVINYQLEETLKALSLDDFFPENSLSQLLQYLSENLKEQGAAWIIDESVLLNKELLSLFTFSPLGFTFYFPPYTVGPYVQGPFEVLVPSTLKNLNIENKLLSFIQ